MELYVLHSYLRLFLLDIRDAWKKKMSNKPLYSLSNSLDGFLVLHAELDECDSHHDGRAAQSGHAVHRHRRLRLVLRSVANEGDLVFKWFYQTIDSDHSEAVLDLIIIIGP